MSDERITLTRNDFEMLLSGQEVTTTKGTKIILSDIGFELMRQMIDVEIRRREAIVELRKEKRD